MFTQIIMHFIIAGCCALFLAQIAEAVIHGAHRIEQASVLAQDIAEAESIASNGEAFAPVRSGLPLQRLGPKDALGGGGSWLRMDSGATAYFAGAIGSDIGLDGTVASRAGSVHILQT